MQVSALLGPVLSSGMAERTGTVLTRDRSYGPAWGWIFGVVFTLFALWALVLSKSIAVGVGIVFFAAIEVALVVVAWKGGLWLLRRLVFTVSQAWNEGKSATRKS